MRHETTKTALRQLVERQANDEGLWFVAQTAPEGHLQRELRRLHSAVEAVLAGECYYGKDDNPKLLDAIRRNPMCPENLAAHDAAKRVLECCDHRKHVPTWGDMAEVARAFLATLDVLCEEKARGAASSPRASSSDDDPIPREEEEES